MLKVSSVMFQTTDVFWAKGFFGVRQRQRRNT